MFSWLKKSSPLPENAGQAPIGGTPGKELAGKASPLEESNACKKRGNEFLAQGLLEEAAECYRQAIAFDSDHAEGYLNLGFALHGQQHYEEAEKHLKHAIQLNSGMEDAYYLLGMIAQEQGKLDSAVENFNKALELKPDFEVVYGNLCQLFLQAGRNDAARHILEKGISINPDSADFHLNLGNLFVSEQAPEKAIACYQKVLSIQPDDAEVLVLLGDIFKERGDLNQAVDCYRKALLLQPDSAQVSNNLGVVYRGMGRLEDAEACFRMALSVSLDRAEMHNNLASALYALGKFDDAVEHLQKAISIEPRYAEAYSHLGLVLHKQGKLEAAVESHQKALSINSDYAEAHSNLADALLAQDKLDMAIESYHRALAIKPNLMGSHYNLGNAYKIQGNFEASAGEYLQAISLKPDFANAHLNLGAVLIEQGLRDRAMQCFQNAILVDPNFVEAHLALSLNQLLIGDFERGWAGYEWRWQSAQMQLAKYDYKQPLWLGNAPLSGKTILLHFEQGFGDTIQFCRYAKLLAAQDATVLLLVPAALKSLLTGLEGVSQVFAEGEPIPAFDYHCPLMSLPLAFSTRISTIPAEAAYLKCDSSHVLKWQNRLGNRPRPRVGLVWSGNQRHMNDHNRSIPLNDLFELTSDQVEFVSLQKEIAPNDQIRLNHHKHIVDVGADLEDFADTAGLIANLDLVISVDTAVAHLAGAMGRPVWILLPYNPDWRWMLERSDSPWYPSARLFRQAKKGDWMSILSLVDKELKKYVRG